MRGIEASLTDLKRVLDFLETYWTAVYSDAVLDAGGNRERIAYEFDKRQVAFNELASAAFGPRKEKATEYFPEVNWWRPPDMTCFKSGNDADTPLLPGASNVRCICVAAAVRHGVHDLHRAHYPFDQTIISRWHGRALTILGTSLDAELVNTVLDQPSSPWRKLPPCLCSLRSRSPLPLARLDIAVE